MNNKKEIIRSIVFIAIGILILQILTIICIPKWTGQIDPATPRWQEFYARKQATIDA